MHPLQSVIKLKLETAGIANAEIEASPRGFTVTVSKPQVYSSVIGEGWDSLAKRLHYLQLPPQEVFPVADAWQFTVVPFVMDAATLTANKIDSYGRCGYCGAPAGYLCYYPGQTNYWCCGYQQRNYLMFALTQIYTVAQQAREFAITSIQDLNLRIMVAARASDPLPMDICPMGLQVWHQFWRARRID